jgi:CheY-like chemotaxis protein
MRQPHGKDLPPQADNNQAPDGEPTDGQRREKPGVLVVDDEHQLRILLQLGLERSGFDVWLAPSGREAVRLYRKHRIRIAVALIDVRMADMDGPQTLNALRELNPKVLACFMSGDTGNYDADELRRRGAAHVIDKPFRVDQLVDLLRQLVHGVPAERLPSGGHARVNPATMRDFGGVARQL